MKKRSFGYALGLCVAILASLNAASSLAYADPYSLTGLSAITIPEDGVWHSFFYTLTNNSGGTLTDLSLGNPALETNPSGDPDDQPLGVQYGFIDAATCALGSSLADGLSCTMEFQVRPIDGTGETDGDSGSFGNTLTVGFIEATAGETVNPFAGVPVILDEPVTVTITDLAVDPVPEPASILLLGGALGCVGLVCRRRRWRSRFQA